MLTKINLNGIDELDFPTGVDSASTSGGVTTINLSASSTHSEMLTDGNGNLIFASTPTMGGDLIVAVVAG